MIGNSNGDDLVELSWNCQLADALAQQVCYWLQTMTRDWVGTVKCQKSCDWKQMMNADW
jgi:hypothetical protein